MQLVLDPQCPRTSPPIRFARPAWLLRYSRASLLF
jgi:hypothetical protein